MERNTCLSEKTQRGTAGAEQRYVDRKTKGHSKTDAGQGKRESAGGPALSVIQGLLCPDPLSVLQCAPGSSALATWIQDKIKCLVMENLC